jgi:alpha-tubulin suppressor-like RCC1 family protein
VAPQKVNLPLAHPKKTRVVGIACGRAHSLVLTDAEGVFSLGHNGYGQCGRRIVPDEDYFNSGCVHNMAPASERVVAVCCGQDSR